MPFTIVLTALIVFEVGKPMPMEAAFPVLRCTSGQRVVSEQIADLSNKPNVAFITNVEWSCQRNA